MADRRGRLHRRLSQSTAVVVALIVGIGLLDAAVWTDVNARTRSQNEEAALAAANTHLATLRHRGESGAVRQGGHGNRARLSADLDRLDDEPACGDQRALANANVDAYVQGVGIDTLQTCLGGVKSAFDQITAKNNAGAAKDISAVSGPCTQLAGGSEHRTGLSLRLPRPFRHSGGPDLLRLCHELGGRQHPDHRLHRSLALDRDRECSAEPPRLGDAQQYLGSLCRNDRRHVCALLRGPRGRNGRRVHLSGNVQPTPGTVSRHVDGTVGVPEVSRRVH